MSAQTAAIQGSGWGWLAYDAATDSVCIKTCANQDPCSTTGTTPLLGIDVWEHAYYLDVGIRYTTTNYYYYFYHLFFSLLHTSIFISVHVYV